MAPIPNQAVRRWTSSGDRRDQTLHDALKHLNFERALAQQYAREYRKHNQNKSPNQLLPKASSLTVGQLVSPAATEFSKLTRPASDTTDAARDRILLTEIGSASDPQPLEGGTAPAPSDSAVLRAGDTAQELHCTPHPIRGIVARIERDGTVRRVYVPPLDHIRPGGVEFPLLSEEDLRVVVPQLPYPCRCAYTQEGWEPKPAIHFFARNRLGVKLTDAFLGKFVDMNDRDDYPFGAECRGITVRLHFPGYPSSVDVEKTLKQQAESHRGMKPRTMQLSTKNYKTPPEPVTKSKLVQELSKRIKWHIEYLEANSILFPFDDRVDQQWRLGQGRMEFEQMVIIGIANVSSGSWSPIICVEPLNVPDGVFPGLDIPLAARLCYYRS